MLRPCPRTAGGKESAGTLVADAGRLVPVDLAAKTAGRGDPRALLRPGAIDFFYSSDMRLWEVKSCYNFRYGTITFAIFSKRCSQSVIK